MTVRTAYPATESAGDVLTASNFDKLPGGWIGYAEATTNQGSITSEADLTSLTVAVTVNTSRRIRITGKIEVASNAADDGVLLNIKESTTVLQRFPRTIRQTSVSEGLECSVVLTPSAGAHTYKLTLQRFIGSGTLTMQAASTYPAFILVEDLGPSS